MTARKPEELDELMRRFEMMPEDPEQVVDLLEDDHMMVREAAMMKLRILDGVDDDVFMTALDNESFHVRARAALELGWRKVRYAIPLLLEHLASDPSGGVRAMCAIALGNLGGDDALDGLQAALDDRNAQVRLTACSAFGRRRDHRATDKLQSMLQDPDFHVRTCVVRALISLGVADGRAVVVAEQLLSDPVHTESEASVRETEEEIRAVLDDPQELARYAESTETALDEARAHLEEALKAACSSSPDLQRLVKRARRVATKRSG